MSCFSRRCSMVAAVSVSILVAAGGFVLAGKGGTKKPPGEEPPPPPGTIYFTYDGASWAMDGNGNGKTPIADGSVTATSSRLLYGTGYRWSLAVQPTGDTYDRVVDENGDEVETDWPQNEVFARRLRADGTFEEIQLTDLYGDINAMGHSTYGSQFVRWSNDQADSFVSFKCWDISDAVTIETDGTTTLLGPRIKGAIVRIWISGSEIDMARADLDPIDWASGRADVVVRSSSLYEGNFKHDWSPDGNKIVYVLDEAPTTSGISEDVWVKDVATGTVQMVWPANSHVDYPNWQPFGSRITFSYGGDVYAVDPDGANDKTLIPSTAHAVWSPDGQYMVYTNAKRKGSGPTRYQLDRIREATGETVPLTGDLDSSLNQGPIGWFPDAWAGL